MNVTIRAEKAADYFESEMVTRAAFWNHFSPGCDEHYLLHIMRNSPAFVPGLDLVAVQDDRIVGHAVCVTSRIVGDDGEDYEVLTLGPISVLPECQGQGIGGRLIEALRQQAWEMGYRAILLYGDPGYYTRQGFVPAETLGIRTADNMYAAALHACELYAHALQPAKGCFVEDDIYQVDAASAAEYDKHFPPREKISGTPSQQWFEKMVEMRRPAHSQDGGESI